MAILAQFSRYQLIYRELFACLVQTYSGTKLYSQQTEILATVSCKHPSSSAVNSESSKLFIKVHKTSRKIDCYYCWKKPMWFSEENMWKGQPEKEPMTEVPELTDPDWICLWDSDWAQRWASLQPSEGAGWGGSKGRANLMTRPCEVKPMSFTQLCLRAFMCATS